MIKYLIFSLLITTTAHPFTIMLAPAGDARHPGREIHGTFERGVALQFAEKLKHALERKLPVRVLLSNFSGETIAPLQNANFANRSGIDLYLSLHFYGQTDDERPQIFLYRFSYGDDFITKRPALSFERYDQAHLHSKETSQRWGSIIAHTFSEQPYQLLFHFNKFVALPFKPLIGITAPALGIEAGIKEQYNFDQYIAGLVTALGHIYQDQA